MADFLAGTPPEDDGGGYLQREEDEHQAHMPEHHPGSSQDFDSTLEGPEGFEDAGATDDKKGRKKRKAAGEPKRGRKKKKGLEEDEEEGLEDADTPGKGRRRGPKPAAERDQRSSQEICGAYDIEDVPLDFSEEDYQSLTTYKLFSARLRPLFLEANPKVASAKIIMLLGAKWREFVESNPHKDLIVSADTSMSNSPAAAESEKPKRGKPGPKPKAKAVAAAAASHLIPFVGAPYCDSDRGDLNRELSHQLEVASDLTVLEPSMH